MLKRLFAVAKPIIGTLHLPALPGAPGYDGQSMTDIVAYALRDLDAYVRGGVDGVIVENMGDLPFLKPRDIGPETVAAISVVAAEVRRATTRTPMVVGINVLANDAIKALAVAKATDASFIRVNQWANAYIADEGLVEGEAGKVLRYRSSIRAENVAVFADVHVKHGSHSIVADRSIAEQAMDAVFFRADVLIASGSRTGAPPSVEVIQAMKGVSSCPVLAGSGIDTENVDEILSYADGAIVGSSFKRDGLLQNEVDAGRVAAFMAKVASVRARARAVTQR